MSRYRGFLKEMSFIYQVMNGEIFPDEELAMMHLSSSSSS
jgi:hypothetical protein